MKKWGKPENIIAQIVLKDQIPGLLHKEISLENKELALVRKNALIAEELGPGTHQIKDFTDLVLVDVATKTIRKTVQNLLTMDDNTVSCELEIRFDIYLAEKLARNLMVDRIILSTDDLYSELYNELISKVLSPTIRQKNIKDLYGNRKVVDEIQISFETELKKLLEMWGIELITLSIIWKFPDDYKQYLKKSAASRLSDQEKETEHKEKVKEVLMEKELEKLKPKSESKEEVKSRLEKSSLESEVGLNLRKKESVEDDREALDALKLKEIMDKQKIEKKALKKNMGVD